MNNMNFESLLHNGKTNIMGILNVTPDSFSDGGSFNTLDKALFHCQEMINDGAAIVDIGGESTRPGYTKISDEEEIERVLPVIKAVKENFDILISLDTYKPAVVVEGIRAGVDMINDIWGGTSEDICRAVAESEVYYCLMHNRKNTDEMLTVDDFCAETVRLIEFSESFGIKRDKIVVDPGVGFSKTKPQDLACIKGLSRFTELGYPVLLGTSRKSCIGYVLGNEINERLYGTLATTAAAFYNNVSIVRVHDIKENYEFLKMLENIV